MTLEDYSSMQVGDRLICSNNRQFFLVSKDTDCAKVVECSGCRSIDDASNRRAVCYGKYFILRQFSIAVSTRTLTHNGKTYRYEPFSIDVARDIMQGKVDGICSTNDNVIVRLICLDAKGDFPIIGLIDYGNNERPKRFRSTGGHRDDCLTDFDLQLWLADTNNTKQ